jgi:predicted flap endonuclease-1-like 5' DNA nuclease
MKLLALNPLSPSVAITEMVIILLVASLIGYFIGRWITKGRLKKLQQVLEAKESELNECKDRQVVISSGKSPAPHPADENGDDLKKIEGIGPKIEKVLNTNGVFRFEQLANTSPELILEWLKQAGPQFQIHQPGSWPDQAALARDNRWEELEVLQEKLTGGR